MGTISLSGALAKQGQKPLAGAITPSGSLSKFRTIGQSLSATLSIAGSTIVRTVSKGISGTATITGVLGKLCTRPFTGVITPSGNTISKVIAKPLTGALTLSSTLSKHIAMVIQWDGSPDSMNITLSGSLTRLKTVTQSFTGSITLTTSTIAKLCMKGLTGGLTQSGSTIVKAISKGIASTLGIAGALAKKAIKATFTGSLSLSGLLDTLKQLVTGGSPVTYCNIDFGYTKRCKIDNDYTTTETVDFGYTKRSRIDFE